MRCSYPAELPTRGSAKLKPDHATSTSFCASMRSTSIPAARTDPWISDRHQASATEPTVCRCAPASWIIPTQGEGSSQTWRRVGSGGEAGSQAFMSWPGEMEVDRERASQPPMPCSPEPTSQSSRRRVRASRANAIETYQDWSAIGAPLWLSGDEKSCSSCGRLISWLDIVSSGVAGVHSPEMIANVILGDRKYEIRCQDAEG